VAVGVEVAVNVWMGVDVGVCVGVEVDVGVGVFVAVGVRLGLARFSWLMSLALSAARTKWLGIKS